MSQKGTNTDMKKFYLQKFVVVNVFCDKTVARLKQVMNIGPKLPSRKYC